MILEEMRKANVYGIRVERSFRQAATRFLLDYQHKRSIGRYAQSLKILDPHIGDLPLRRVHQGTLESFIRHRLKQGMRANTINRDLAVVSVEGADPLRVGRHYQSGTDECSSPVNWVEPLGRAPQISRSWETGKRKTGLIDL